MIASPCHHGKVNAPLKQRRIADLDKSWQGKFKRELPADREKKFAQMGVSPGYTSEARDNGSSGGTKPKLYQEGLIPGYGGHKKEAKFSFGSSIYTNGVPKGGKLDNWSGKNFASTGHGASSKAN